MNERIQRLRERSLNTRPSISAERAVLMTEFYRSREAQGLSAPMKRARAFAYMMERKTVCINPDELIVGERGPQPKAVPTYPEICIHSLQDLDILNSRKYTHYDVPSDVREVYEKEIIPFWTGNSQRERILGEMAPEWREAYEAGMFTEFQEQRAPGHTVLGDKIFRKGMLDIQCDIREAIAVLDFVHDPAAYDKREELKAMEICAGAVIHYAERHAEKLEELARGEQDAQRRGELEAMARVCRRVPAHAPETFWEALQYYWFVHISVITELNTWDSFNPGRLDQHLWLFFERESAQGTLSREQARELLQAFWVKFNNHPAPPKVGVTAQESNTYTDFSLINVGGVKADGSDAVNELTYLILDVIEEMRLLQPSSMVQISKKNPDRLVKRAIKIIKTGFGQPSLFNTDAIVQELVRQGKSLEDARCGGASGCVESGAFGKEAYILTGYFNLPKVVELTLHNGVDPRTGKRIGLETGAAESFESFDAFFQAFEKQVRHFIDIKIRGNNIIDALYARYLPAPFLSLVVDDCVARGMDYNQGGARYNTSYIQGVGLGSVTDVLTAIRYHVFDRQTLSMSELVSVLDANFEGSEALRRSLLDETPKFGNDNDYADGIMRRVFDVYFNAVDGRPNVRGGMHRINLLPTTVHVYFGSVIGALPDGRLAGEPLSEGISPVQGADRKGPTAVLLSAAKMDHLKTGGTLLNQKFSPHLFDNPDTVEKMTHLIRSYFRMDGHHIQFNVVTAETLRKAQREPEKHKDLIVRVAGYSDYFVDLTEDLQNEIICRTEHELMA